MIWKEVYKEHSSTVYRFILGLTHCKEDAEDYLQETFIRAMQAKSELREDSKTKAWLMTIARNVCMDNFKKRSTRMKVTVSGDIEVLEETTADHSPSPEKQVLDMDFKENLNLVLNKMSEAYRTAFTLGVVMKLPYQEICQITGWSLPVVKSNIFRARKGVAEALSEYRTNC